MTSVRFPGTMVDRIVPATTDAHRAEAQALLGLSDAGLVVGEPFTQWVIQDTFAGPRPAWERAGATLTADVAPYERAKLRDPQRQPLDARLPRSAAGARDDRAGGRRPRAGGHCPRRSSTRTSCPRSSHPTAWTSRRTATTSWRGSPTRTPGTPPCRSRWTGRRSSPSGCWAPCATGSTSGAVPTAAAATVAAWIAYVRATSRGELEVDGRQVGLDDPMAPVLAAAADGPLDTLADRMLDVHAVFGDDLAGSDEFRSAVRAAVADLVTVRA